mgnify:CR=1 FL=1
MAWTNLTLTVDGRNALNQAQFDNQLNFKSIVVGDGTAPANFRTQKKLVHQLYELTDLKIDKTESGCTLTADFPKVDYDYYFREVGIIVTTKEGDKLYVYDNCGEDAQYIVSSTGAETTQKRLRLALVISDIENITISEPSILYVAYDDYERTILELNQTKVDKVEGKGLSENDYTNADKNKLYGIEEGAEVNVQSDWNITDSNSDAYIKNKPQSMKNPTSLNISLNGISQGAYDGSSQKSINITAKNVGADTSGTAETKVSEHNTSEAAHADIRNLITTLANRFNALANSDDTTLDQLSEIVAYIKNNKSLIDGITTSKVNVSDIIDNLTSNVVNKPLSAKQGKVLKDLITTLTSIVDGKVNKAGDTMTGDLIVPNTRPNTSNPTLPASGSLVLPNLMNLRDYRGFLGTYSRDGNSDWNYLINVRHRNGFGDGNLYGMYIKAPLSGNDKNLSWGFQHIKEWSKERTILDSVNYKRFCTPENIGLGNVNNTPDYLKHVEAATYLTGWGDTRNVETTPNTYSEKFKVVGLKTAAASKITTGSSFATLLGIRGWSDSSAGKAHELAFDGNGKLLHRVGLTSWESWKEIAYIDDTVLLSGGTMNENAIIHMKGTNTSIDLSAGNNTTCITNNSVSVENNVCQLSFLSKIENTNRCGLQAFTKSNSRTGGLYFYNGDIFPSAYSRLNISITKNPEIARSYTFDETGLWSIVDDVDLGKSSFQWRNIYATNGTIQTSDRTRKTDVNSLEAQKAQAFIHGLNPVSYKMLDGTSGRTHYGFIAQDIEELMNTLNMDSSDFAGFIKSPKKVIKYEDENGTKLENPIEEVVENEYDYALRYDEFIAPLIKVVQEQQKTIEQQQIAIKNQQKEIEQIKKELSKMDSSM